MSHKLFLHSIFSNGHVWAFLQPVDAAEVGIEQLVGHCQVDEYSVESPKGIAVSCQLEHNMSGIA